MMKQVIVVRSDLKLGVGKIAAHAAHASLEALRVARAREPRAVEEWEREGEKKVVVKIEGEKELLALYEKAKGEVPCALIRDAGLTQIPPGTLTALGLGPGDERVIDKYTGKLKLL
ncbi:MAG: peptidyl-tRNA hydrolase Pth2 [Candidatus Micrarchaeia archaeon]